MFGEINNILGISPHHLPNDGSFYLITDSLNADGSFLISHFLHLYLKSLQSVCFVSFEQSFFHYFGVARKLGINLLNEKKLTFINCLSQPYEWTTSISSIPAKSSVSFDNFTFQISDISLSFRSLYKKIANIVEAFENGGCVILDSLNILTNLSNSTIDLIHLIRYLKQLAKRKKCTVICLFHEEGEEEEQETGYGQEKEEERERILAYEADVLLSVEELSSGYSKDVHGQLSILYKDRLSANQPHIFHYQLTENNVKLFTKPTQVNKLRI